MALAGRAILEDARVWWLVAVTRELSACRGARGFYRNNTGRTGSVTEGNRLFRPQLHCGCRATVQLSPEREALLHNQHRHFGVMRQPVAHAAQQQPAHFAQAARADDDAIAAARVGDCQDALGGRALQHLHVHLFNAAGAGLLGGHLGGLLRFERQPGDDVIVLR